MVDNIVPAEFLNDLPPVEFCCAYGSALHGNHDKTTMVDYILGVSDPMQWHSQNLEMNKDHYASLLMVYFGGAKLITQVADKIGVGVHFNPFVVWNDRMIKYGVVRMHDLVQDICHWEHFYLSGRLQKPVNIYVDNVGIANLNSVNLKAATATALLFSPPEFTEEQLYAKICGLSYMGDLRMLFAEDKNKVNKIVRGQFHLFKTMYKPILEEYAANGLLRFTSSGKNDKVIQDCGLPATHSLLTALPSSIQSRMGMRETGKLSHPSRIGRECVTGSREEAANIMRSVLRRKVMVSSARQAVAGVIAGGGIHAAHYLSSKMSKWWNSLKG
ncbi:hypothetical protein ACHQM5_012587 [Ranunculus cassubicifolius]